MLRSTNNVGALCSGAGAGRNRMAMMRVAGAGGGLRGCGRGAPLRLPLALPVQVGGPGPGVLGRQGGGLRGAGTGLGRWYSTAEGGVERTRTEEGSGESTPTGEGSGERESPNDDDGVFVDEGGIEKDTAGKGSAANCGTPEATSTPDEANTKTSKKPNGERDSPSDDDGVIVDEGGVEKDTADEESAAKDGTPEATPSPENANTQASKKPKPRKLDGDLMLQIAKAGTSPKVREEEAEAVQGRLTKENMEWELKWLQDPKALADRVANLLRADDLATAAALARKAQKAKRRCLVAWNNILQYTIEKGHPMAAFRFFNDMKKRGVRSNSFTYTVMLKGLSQAEKTRDFDPVKVAWSIYKSITGPKSVAQLNTYHSNTMLAVCSRHGDLDTLWRVAGSMPENGLGAPDRYTYTIIVKAITDVCSRDVSKMDPTDLDKIHARKVQAIKEAKSLWPDVVHQWASGNLALDGAVVHSVASLLLEGATDQDCYDVLLLYNQTCGIPVFARKPLPDPSRESVEKSGSGEEAEDVPFVDENGKPIKREQPEESEEGEEEVNLDHVFDPVLVENGRENAPSYLEVANRGLSTILSACMTMTQGLKAGKEYWDHLTQEDHRYKVKPDSASCHEYLRLLRISRSSRATIDVVRDQMIPDGMAQDKTFHIAFSVLRRDRKNINILKHANELLALMDQSLILPSTRGLEGYLELIQALSDNPELLLSLNGLDVEEQRSSQRLSSIGQKLQLNLKMIAAASLRPHISKLNEAMEKGRISRVPSRGRLAHVVRKHGISGAHPLTILVRTRGMIDEILNSGKSSGTSNEEWKQLKRDSDALKKYSDADVFRKYRMATIIPTDDQILAFREKSEDSG